MVIAGRGQVPGARNPAGHRLRRAVAPPAPPPAHGVGEPPRGGLQHHAGADPPFRDERHHDRELAVLHGEPAGSVDRVDDPDPVRPRRGAGERRRRLLGHQAVGRERGPQVPQDDLPAEWFSFIERNAAYYKK